MGPDRTVTGSVVECFSVVNGIFLKIPRSFAGILPVSPCRLNFPFEPYAFLGLESFVQPGGITLDVGCSYGVMAALLARLVGSEGRVYALDANPELVPTIGELLRCNALSSRVQVLNVCVGEYAGDAEFNVVPGLQSVASTRGSGIRQVFPEARTIRVPMLPLDDLDPSTIAAPPDVVKIDIEGGEHCAIQGARRLLRNHSPDLVIETHGAGIRGVGGSLPELCSELVDLGYSLFDLVGGQPIGADEYAERYVNSNGQLLASRKLRDPGVHHALSEKHRLLCATQEHCVSLWHDLDRARELVNQNQPLEAEPLLCSFLLSAPDFGEAHYLLGVALHALGRPSEAVLARYQMALRCGFDEFWVRYNLGLLYAQQGETEKATEELQRAVRLKPEHGGARAMAAKLLGAAG